MTRVDGAVAPVVVVTGAASGIGAAVVRRLRADGAQVLATDVNTEGLERLADELPGVATTVADVTSEAGARSMVQAALEAFGQLTGAVNAAGIGIATAAPVWEIAPEDWRRILSVDLDGVFFSLRAETAAMVDAGAGGAIVNIASTMGSVGIANGAAYVAAKHGVVGLTRAAAIDGATAGIRVNSVSPGFVDTPLLSPRTRGALAELTAPYPMKRAAQPDEIAAAVVHLLSDDASFVTGADYAVDGGYTIV